MRNIWKIWIASVGLSGLGLCSMSASAGVVDEYCKGFPQRYKSCMEFQESDAILALSEEDSFVLFQGINARRKAGLESGKIKRTPVPVCSAVKDFGRLPKTSDIWAIKCETNQMYGVQFDGDRVFSGMSCAFLGSMLGSPCKGAIWMREGSSEAAPVPKSDPAVP